MAQPPAEAGVEGTWSPLPNQPGRDGKAPTGAWIASADHKALTSVVEPLQTGVWPVARAEPLPEGDWTLDMALTTPAYSGANFLLQVGSRAANGSETAGLWTVQVEPGGEAGVRVYTFGKGIEGNMGQTSTGTTHWLRFTYEAKARRLLGWINGKALRGTAEGLALAREPVRCSITTHTPDQQAPKFTLSVFRVRPGLPAVAPPAVGAAFKGWQRRKPLEQLVIPAELSAQLGALAAAPDVEPEGRADALAALLIGDWATRGQVSADHWNLASQFVEKSLDVNVQALSVLTPLAAACADDKQREQTRKWTRLFFDALLLEPQRRSEEEAMLVRMALCDPAQSAAQLLKRTVPIRAAFSIADDLKSSDPALSLALYQSLNASSAWLLPELRAVAPLQAQDVVNHLLAGQAADNQGQGRALRDLSFAAYRMANADLPLAVKLLERIENAQSRASTLRFMSESLRFAPGIVPDPQAEAALRKMVALWQPSERDDSAVPLLAQIAAWQLASGQKDAAQNTLHEAAAKIGKLPETRFRDTWAIARLASGWQLPDAASWLETARSAATSREANGYGEQAPLTVMTRDLLSDGQRDRALELLRGLPVGTEASSAWQTLLRATLREEPTRLSALLAAMPEGYRRSEQVLMVARLLSRSDPAAARALLVQLPAEARERAEKSLPPSDAKSLGDELSVALKSLRPGAPLPSGNSVFARIERLPLAELAALEPAFAANRTVYARLCLNAIVRAAGLSQDPIWQRFLDAEDQGGWNTPWGVDALEYAVRAEQQNRRERD